MIETEFSRDTKKRKLGTFLEKLVAVSEFFIFISLYRIVHMLRNPRLSVYNNNGNT